MAKKRGFNLLRAQLTPEDRWEQIYTWINNSARVIVIFVELIVIASFVTRVVVDRIARDLDKELEKNKVQLQALEDVESGVVALQNNLEDYSSLWTDSSNFETYLQEIEDYEGGGIENFTVEINSDGRLILSGLSSREGVGGLEAQMKNSDSFDIVRLTTFRPDDDEELSESGQFQIEAQFKGLKRDLSNQNT